MPPGTSETTKSKSLHVLGKGFFQCFPEHRQPCCQRQPSGQPDLGREKPVRQPLLGGKLVKQPDLGRRVVRVHHLKAMGWWGLRGHQDAGARDPFPRYWRAAWPSESCQELSVCGRTAGGCQSLAQDAGGSPGSKKLCCRCGRGLACEVPCSLPLSVSGASPNHRARLQRMVKIRRESSTTTTNTTTTAPYNITTIINLDSPDCPSAAGGAITTTTTPTPTTTAPTSSSSVITCTVMRLPLHTSLPDGTRVTVNVVTGPHVAEVYNMIQDAAIHGDGYGVDEFPTEKDFLQEVQSGNGKVFRVCAAAAGSDAGGETIAAFVVLDSKYFRGQGTVADCYVIVKREERRKGLGDFCMQMILQFAGRMGYLGIYADTFQDNVAMRKILELSGFQRVGALPMSGKMPDGSVKPSVIYYCELGPLPPPVSHQSHIGERPNPNLQEVSNGTDSDTSPF